MTPEAIQTIAICATVVIIAFGAFRLFHRLGTKTIDAPKDIVKTGGDAVRQNIEAVGSEIRNLLGATPEITLNRTVIQQAPVATCEVYFWKQSTETREQLTSKWLGSSKSFAVSQKFVVKAGFDLNKLRLNFDEQPRELHASIDDALLVSVEYDGPFQVEKSESGLWNRITGEERNQLINSLPAKARAELETSPLRQLAFAALQKALSRICEKNGMQLQIDCAPPNQEVRDAKTLAEPSSVAIETLGLLNPQK